MRAVQRCRTDQKFSNRERESGENQWSFEMHSRGGGQKLSSSICEIIKISCQPRLIIQHSPWQRTFKLPQSELRSLVLCAKHDEQPRQSNRSTIQSLSL